MILLQVLVFLVLGNGLSNAWIKKCKYKVCDGYEWKDDWSPSISKGQCVQQIRTGHPKYKTKTAVVCIPIPCFPSIQTRTKCKYCMIFLRNGIELIEIESFVIE